MRARDLAVSRQLEVVTEHILNYLEVSTWKDAPKGLDHDWHRLPLSHFREAEPWLRGEHGRSITDSLWRANWEPVVWATHPEDDENEVTWEAKPRDVGYHWDICQLDVPPNDRERREMAEWRVSQGLDPEWWDRDCILKLRRMRSVDLRELRSMRAPFRSPVVGEVSHAWVQRDYSFYTGRTLHYYQDGRWLPLFPPDMGAGLNEDHSLYLNAALSEQFTRQFVWRVVLGGRRTSVSFDTDPIGARAMFKLREIPPGMDRREALLHWVREHWRRRRKDPGEETKVRTHMRGAERFEWADLQCKIVPAPDDVATVEKARLAREQEIRAEKSARRRR